MTRMRIRLENRLGRHAPRLYLSLREAARRVKRRLGHQSYAEARKDYNYYREVLRLGRVNLPVDAAVIDVGAGETTIIGELSVRRRVTLDERWLPPRPGIEHITADFCTWQPDARYDLVLCLQVLEHLPDPGPFARKLFTLGERVIISVPYRWRAGACKGHVQDPVDAEKLSAWTGRDPAETLIVKDGLERLIAVYPATETTSAQP